MHYNINISGLCLCSFNSAGNGVFLFCESTDNQYCFDCANSTAFTGKERDAETGYSYFGARYYDSDLSGLFLSVDPMSDKYPNLSPYAYCAWNPVKLVDPDGEEIWIVGDDGNSYQYKDGKLYTQDGQLFKGNDAFANRINDCLNDISSSIEGLMVVAQLETSETKYTYKNESTANPNAGGGFSDKTLDFKVKNATFASIAHETFHAYQYECGMRGRTDAREVGAYLFQALMINANLNNSRWSDCNMALSAYQGGSNYMVAIDNLVRKGFSEGDYRNAVNYFFSESQHGQDYLNAGYTNGIILKEPPIKSVMQR